ncbi:lysine exporter LysO family protein [Sediminitomix flava]|uniref:Lysine exporter LysO-like protein n=1 Tax=Sediminitomix flava TaxID=379075 RepID=A0A315ZC24_SEDFL|nr:lysine exporter LysO family protein [Sediminitomix flava]PWJ43125.1 lysine exporter LysO-like protein [Sediminitomix flava]
MKGTLLILLFFVAGCTLSVFGFIPTVLVENDFSTYALYILMFLVGIGIGIDKRAIKMLKGANLGLFLVPLSVGIGSIIGAALINLAIGQGFKEGMAVGAGFGYYSLSSIYITELHGEALGVVALLSNIMRELLTLLITPLLVKFTGNLSPIASAGATSMDTTLPVISQYSGKDYVVVALFNGILLTIAVPLLIPFILN